jgi:LPXTG-motif cell wall-anchored protein
MSGKEARKGRGMAKNKKPARIVLLAVMGLLAGLTAAMMLIGTAAAQETDPYSNEGPTVLPTVIQKGQPKRPDVTEPNRFERPPDDSSLPLTGADLTLFVATGAAAIATGTVLVRRSRARNAKE